ncbi:MAG TPA: deoxyribodipyrimidine photo-lyase [Candidatus Polarisedimenticolia bacterium]|nr:deoxyribodipyrimidine photo-lyase [Candidatus Polarisedimenticolia bacterium]
MSGATVVWLRQDLRLEDQPALAAAAARGGPVVPLYVHAPEEEGDWPPGSASRFWLHHSLTALDGDLRRLGSRLVVRRGASLPNLLDVARRTEADAIHFCARSEPMARLRDGLVRRELEAAGLEVAAFNGHLLYEPQIVRTRAGEPFKVFTPFWNACRALGDPLPPLPAPSRLDAPPAWPVSETIAGLGLLPQPDWAEGMRFAWRPGERGARQRLGEFQRDGLDDYAAARDRPAVAGTSRLSPHLHFGEVSPRQVFHAAQEHGGSGAGVSPPRSRGSSPSAAWLREIGWREFAHHVLHHFPHTPEKPLRSEFDRFPWRRDPDRLAAWQRGRTGYPIVDAGMRELWKTGWMHNRVRMVVASFLVKDLLVTWQEGAAWFWDTLVDADLANNTLNWQWSAGCGADAAPYFRIFNPVLQGRRFDPEGEYVARFVPELARLHPTHRHAPWLAPSRALEEAELVLEEDYPRPIVDHETARKRALIAFQTIRAGSRRNPTQTA